MRKIILSLLGAVGCGFVTVAASAQPIDNTQTLPDAKPGECYAKVITPAVFDTRTEEVIIQEASERIETVEAQYENVEQNIVVREASQQLTVVDTEYETVTEQVETSAAETSWTTLVGNQLQPASPDAVDYIARSGVDLDSVSPGTCFTEFYKEAQYKTEIQRVMTKEATQTISVMPAEYETVQERIVVREASSEVVDVPAVYRTETESVLVEPARSVWQSDCGLVEQTENATGETMCLVQVPARYETLTKTVLDKPATTKTINIPAVYKTISVQKLIKPASERREAVPAEFTNVERQVKIADPVFFWLAKGEEPEAGAQATGREICLTQTDAEFAEIQQQVVATPPSTQSEAVPAAFETVTVEQLVAPATERRIVIPARTRTVSTRVEVEPAKLEWRRVLCESNMTPDIISSLQRALKREGYDPGPVDGILGAATLRAIDRFQRSEGLDRRGLTFESLEALKVQS